MAEDRKEDSSVTNNEETEGTELTNNDEKKNSVTESDDIEESIDCGSWTFPWLSAYSLYRLAAYIHKLYQDAAAVGDYYVEGQVFFCVISVLCLAIPAIIYTIYIILVHLKKKDGITKQEAGEKIAHGLLLIPWQIKSAAEVLHFSVQRICHRRPPSVEEKIEHLSLENKAVILEFFEDFFAGFLQLLAQSYIILMYYERVGNVGRDVTRARDNEDRPQLHYQALIASGVILLSMLMAVRQKDDGILTTFLSFSGWSLTMASRAFTIALAATVIHSGIIGFCFVHAIGVTVWLIPICWRSHVDTQLSRRKKIVTAFLIFFLFGLPSLCYWPILFHLREHKRPAIFMGVITIENSALFCVWYFLKWEKGWSNYCTTYIMIVAVGTCLGCLFLLAYVRMKPKLTGEVVLADKRVQNGTFFGMYYEFFEITFELRISDFVQRNLPLIRRQ